jgi:hypothetical protein
MKKEYDIAQTIYNLNYQKTLKENNYKYSINKEKKTVISLLFIDEKELLTFSELTARNLYSYFKQN